MSRKPGSPKTGGRQPGSLNKRNQELIDKANEMGVDPFKLQLLFAKGDYVALGYDEPIKQEIRARAIAEVCQYLHPKRKAIEVSDSREAKPYIIQKLDGTTYELGVAKKDSKED